MNSNLVENQGMLINAHDIENMLVFSIICDYNVFKTSPKNNFPFKFRTNFILKYILVVEITIGLSTHLPHINSNVVIIIGIYLKPINYQFCKGMQT